MPSFLYLKIIVALMTLSLVVGAGFILYGLTTYTPQIHQPSTPFSLPKNACIHDVQFHDEYITLTYSHNNQLFFSSFHTKKTSPPSSHSILMPQPIPKIQCLFAP